MKMAEKFYDFDPAEMLDSAEAVEIFLTEAIATDDAKFIAAALNAVARAKGMGNIASPTA